MSSNLLAAPDPALIASELRGVLGAVVRRLRRENRLPLSHGSVLARIDREGAQSVSDLALAERVRPQSMAQTVADLEASGLVARRPDPDDRRRAPVELTAAGHDALGRDRVHREGWMARVIAEDFSPAEQALLRDAAALLRRLAESER
jgi:DNA-binding MarR family transcriptional regulator